jgi:hypothetical protein
MVRSAELPVALRTHGSAGLAGPQGSVFEGMPYCCKDADAMLAGT